MTKEILYERPNGLQFTKVVIKQICKRPARYVAEFKFNYKDKGINPFDTSIGGTSPEECKKKSESFLQTALRADEVKYE